MRGGSVAKRYATALFYVAQEQGKLDKFQENLEMLSALIRGNPGLRETLESPVVAISKKKAIFLELEKKLGLETGVKNLILILLDQDRAAVFPLLDLVFRDMADEALGQVRATVISAAPLGDQESQIKGLLEKSLGRKVLLETRVNSQLLGGMIIQVGDKVFDGSLTRQLENLKEEIVKRAVA
jgi:F-type H+-transporting ATPase subunit delta